MAQDDEIHTGQLRAPAVARSTLRHLSEPWPWVIGLVANVATTALMALRVEGIERWADWADSLGRYGLSFVTLVVTSTTRSLLHAAVAVAVAERAAGRAVSPATLLDTVIRRGPTSYVCFVVATALAAVGTAFCVVPGVLITIAWFVSSACAALEAGGPLRALRRSAELTHTHHQTIFMLLVGYCGVAFVPIAVVAVALLGIHGMPGDPTEWAALIRQLDRLDTAVAVVVRVVLGTTSTTLFAVLATVTYLELREGETHLDAAVVAREFE